MRQLSWHRAAPGRAAFIKPIGASPMGEALSKEPKW
jgi:hypothetical protein